MKDIFQRCMLTSDPQILAFFERELLKKRPKKRPITEGLQKFLAEPSEIPQYMEIDENDLLEEEDDFLDDNNDFLDDIIDSSDDSSESENDSETEE